MLPLTQIKPRRSANLKLPQRKHTGACHESRFRRGSRRDDPRWRNLMVGGFMGVGTPERLLDELVRQKKSDSTVIANDAAVPGSGSASCSTRRWCRR